MANTTDTVNVRIKMLDDGSLVIQNFQKKVNNAANKIKTGWKGVNDSFKSWLKTAAKMTLTIVGVTALVTSLSGAVRSVVKDTIEFDRQFTQVRTLLDESKTNVIDMREKILAMGGALGDVENITRGTYQMISSGQEPATALEKLGISAMFAQGGQVALKDSVSVGTTFLNAYGEAAGGLTHIYDVLWQTIKDGVTTAPELANAMGRVVGVAQNAGLSIEELSGSIAIMTQISQNTNESVTSMRGILAEIIKPSQEAADEAERLGINFSIAGVKAMGFSAWLEDAMEKVKKGNGDLSLLWGRVDALNGVFQLTRNNLQNFKDEMVKMNNVTGNSRENFEKYKQSFQGAWETMKNRLQAIFIQNILPLLKDAAEWISKNSDKIESFVKGAISAFKNVAGFIYQFKDAIVFAGRAWLLYFTGKKLLSFRANLIEAFTKSKGSLLSFFGEIKNAPTYFKVLKSENKGTLKAMSGTFMEIKKHAGFAKVAIAAIGPAIASWTISKLMKVYELLEAIGALEAAQNLKRAKALAADNKLYLEKLYYIEWYTRELFESGKTEIHNLELRMQMQEAMKKAQGETYAEKLNWIRRHNKEYPGLIKLIEGGIAAYQIENNVHTELTEIYEKEIKAMYEMRGIPLPQYYKVLKENVEKNTGAVNTSTEAMGKYAEALGIASKEKISDLMTKAAGLTKIFKANKDTFEDNTQKANALQNEISKLSAEMATFGVTAPQSFQDTKKEVANLAIAAVPAVDQMRFLKTIMGVEIPGSAEMAKRNLKNLGLEEKKVKDKTEELVSVFTDLGTVLRAVIGNLSDLGIISESTANSLNAIASGVTGIGAGISAIEKAKDASSSLLGTIQKLSGAFSIATSAVALLTGILKLFAGDGVGEAIDRERQMISITEEMEKKIRELEETIGDTHAATSMLMNEIISQAEINLQNFDSYAQRTRDILADLDRGTLSAGETASALGKAFNELLAAAQRLGTEGTRKMIELIGDVRGRGLEVAEVQDYVNKKLESGVSAIETYLSTFADTGAIRDEIAALTGELTAGNLSTEEAAAKQAELTKKQLDLARATEDVTANWDFMQTAAVSTFHALEAQGNSFVEIVDMMKGQLSTIVKMAKDNGLEISEGLQAMTNLSGFISQNEELTKRIEATRTMMEALGDSAFLTQNDFESFGSQTVQQFQDIMTRTSDQEMALRLIGPALEDLIKYSQAYGFSIDEATQNLIQQGIEAGVVSQDMRTDNEKIVDGLNRVVDAIDRLATGLGVKIPDAIRGMEDAAGRAFPNIQREIGAWSNSLDNVENQLSNTLPEAVERLDDTVKEHMTGHSIVTETEKWTYVLEKVDKNLWTIGDTVSVLDVEYTKVTRNISDEIRETCLKSLEEIEDQMRYATPDALETLSAKYELIMGQMKDATRDYAIDAQGNIRPLLQMLQIVGNQAATNFGGRYGVYTDTQKEGMTADYYKLQNLYWYNKSTILSSERNLSEFVRDLSELVVIDEAQKEFSRFLSTLQIFQGRLEAGWTWTGSDWEKPVSASRGASFIVPPGYEEDLARPWSGYPLAAHSGELVKIFTREETRQILDRGSYLSNRSGSDTAVPVSPFLTYETLNDFFNYKDFDKDEGGQEVKLNDGIAPLFVPNASANVEKKIEIKIEVNIENVQITLQNSMGSEGIDRGEIQSQVEEILEDNVREFADKLADEVQRRIG